MHQTTQANGINASAFNQAFERLNQNQRAAVEQTDGPLLVVAGPGTGKTQLLSARVAHILQSADTLPNNILCLTFTESGASNMRDRLTSFIGQAAYDVTINTYHAFGGDLIGRFPQYFGSHREQSPVDRLGQRQIIQAIVDEMSFKNPLKSAQYHLHDLLSTISEVKKGLLTEDDLRAIAQDNLLFLDDVNGEIKQIFADFTKMSTKVDLMLPYFQNLYSYITQRGQADYTLAGGIKPLAATVMFELGQAIADVSAGDSKPSTKPLTAWKNKWLEKDADNSFIMAGRRDNLRIEALADVLAQYHQALEDQGLYDFDDMILRSIKALETHADLRFTLHEQYQYIMLDEFQDTNAAQLRLIKLLTNNPVYEGRPNVMAVGDDDQAIYAFQGAEVSNMLEFARMYNGTRVINLTDNYRSHPDILHVARQVAGQIGTRLENSFDDMSKVLTAANAKYAAGQAHIDRHEFQADVGQYDWIAQQIAELVKSGVKPQEIAVLAPRHKQLEPLVGYLNHHQIPVRYEKRENILEAPVVRQLLRISQLILALHDGQEDLADALWPEVLSYNFWQIPTSVIWKLSWQVRDTSDLTWSRAVLETQTPPTATDDKTAFNVYEAGLLLLSLARQAGNETLEVMVDRIIGNEPVATVEADLPLITSPLKSYYMGQDARTEGADLFYQTLSHLTCLRERLRDHQKAQEDPLKLQDLINLVNLYQAAEERMLNTSPYNQHAEAVQLMTVFKAKGLEFEHVFLPSVQDDVWGDSSRSNANRLTLPPNMASIRPAGTTADERLRIFFVAVTRARLGLHLTSYLKTYSGRSTKRLKYLNEQAEGDGFRTLILPAERQEVKRIDREVPELNTLELNWRRRHLEYRLGDSHADNSTLAALLQDKLQDYRLSPTHFSAFTDLINAGPEAFFFNYILCFPSASHPAADYGTAVHESLQWVQQQVDANDMMPPVDATLAYFEARLKRKKIRTDLSNQYLEKGKLDIVAFLEARSGLFKRGNKAEYNFRNENVFVDNVHMSGKIDLMEIDRDRKTVTVIDFKTGASFDRWSSDAKLHKYKRQLICYKLLIENSRAYKGYTVPAGRLEFIEPDSNGRIISLELKFDDANVKQEVEQTKQLLQVVWQHIHALEFPDVSDYDHTLSGIKQFEAALLAK